MIPGGDTKKRALGRGLSALIPQAAAAPMTTPVGLAGQVQLLPVDRVLRDGNQPRKSFDEAKLQELASSIQAQGLLQPLLVRKDGEGYRLIAGERRWRAAQLAGLQEVPCLIREATEAQAFELALVENLQRADLNPLEEAEGYRRLIDDFALTQEQVSQRVGKERSSVANALRLLSLPDEVKALVASGELSMGQARAVLGAGSPQEMVTLAAQVTQQHLSVRDTERLVKDHKAGGGPAKKKSSARETVQVRELVEDLQRRLGTKVRLSDKGGKGTIEIDFFSYEDLDRLLELLRK